MTCREYHGAFLTRAAEAHERGDAVAASVHALFVDLCSMKLVPDAAAALVPGWKTSDGQRSAAPEDFGDPILSVLQELLTDIADDELRARVADLLWLHRDPVHRAAGEAAVDAYLGAVARLLDPEHWSDGARRLVRALQIAAALGKRGKRFGRVVERIEETLAAGRGTDPLFLSAELIEALLAQRAGDPARNAAITGECAARAAQEAQWERARLYLDLQSRCCRAAKDSGGERAARLRVVDAHVAEADAALQRPSPDHLVAAHHLQRALVAVRRIPNTDERRLQLHQRLLAAQAHAPSQMRVISASYDAKEMADEARALVTGKSLLDALVALAMHGRPAPESWLREQAQREVETTIFRRFAAQTVITAAGTVTARPPSVFSTDPSEAEQGLRAVMHEHAVRYRSVRVQGRFLPALAEIAREHHATAAALRPLVAASAFVPAEREEIYARGFAAGLQGDWLVAGHLLVPQVENSLRFVLAQQGVPTSGLTDQGIQDEVLLGPLLHKPELRQIFGGDLVFDLQGLLQERTGSNLRNRVAHGLLDHDQFWGEPVVYLWWLTLRVCVLPIVTPPTLVPAEEPAPTVPPPGGRRRRRRVDPADNVPARGRRDAAAG